METTKKLNLFNDKKEISKLDEFMNRYNQNDKLYVEDFNTLIEEINKYKKVIQSLDNENNELKKELNKYKIEYQKLYKSYKNLQTKAFIPKKKIQQITEQQIQEIKTLRNQGLSYSEIERNTKWSKYTISRVLNGHYDK